MDQRGHRQGYGMFRFGCQLTCCWRLTTGAPTAAPFMHQNAARPLSPQRPQRCGGRHTGASIDGGNDDDDACPDRGAAMRTVLASRRRLPISECRLPSVQ